MYLFELFNNNEGTTPYLGNGTHFFMDATANYFTIAEMTNVQAYSVPAASCSSTQFFDSVALTCQACQTGCATCFSAN